MTASSIEATPFQNFVDLSCTTRPIIYLGKVNVN